MSLYSRSSEKRKYLEELDEIEDNFEETYERHGSMSPPHLDREKKMRREIANCNERRRMQSINAGFQSLKALIPHHDGEKMSKAAILQQTTDYINTILQDKTKLLAQNNHLKKLLAECDRDRICEVIYRDSPPPKRKKRDTESSDEGIAADYDDAGNNVEEIKRELIDVRNQLERERQLRKELEEEIRAYNSHYYSPERLHQLATHVNVQMQKEKMLGQIKEEKIMQTERHGYVSESMSRRNLETIVEAIRHLEGEGHAFDERRNIPLSEESGKDTTSESDSVKSDSSDRDSPYYVQDRQSSIVSSPHQAYHQKFPIATNLLHTGTLSAQYLCRPGVIVQKS